MDMVASSAADAIERIVRMHVLATAAQPSPVSRPVVLDRVRLGKAEGRETKATTLQLFCKLHPTSSSCICKAHGLSPMPPGEVVVRFETCGRRLMGNGRCPLHTALDSDGRARFRLRGRCTERTAVRVSCVHGTGRDAKPRLAVDVKMNDAQRKEIAAIMVVGVELRDVDGSPEERLERKRPVGKKQKLCNQ